MKPANKPAIDNSRCNATPETWNAERSTLSYGRAKDRPAHQVSAAESFPTGATMTNFTNSQVGMSFGKAIHAENPHTKLQQFDQLHQRTNLIPDASDR